MLGLSTRGGTTIHMHASTVGRTESFSTHKPNGSWARVDHVLVPARRVEATTAAILSSIKPHEKGRSSDHVPVCVTFNDSSRKS